MNRADTFVDAFRERSFDQVQAAAASGYTVDHEIRSMLVSGGHAPNMIVTKTIPINAQDFIRRCGHHCRLGKYAKDGNYLDFLIAETGRSHPKLLELLRVIDRKAGKPRYYAEADHIIPQAVWSTLMPRELCGPDRPDGVFMHALSNLFWRGPIENHSLDHEAIRHIRSEVAAVLRQAPAKRQAWSAKWIEIFLLTKRDEALAFPGDLVNLSAMDNVPARGSGTNWMGGTGT